MEVRLTHCALTLLLNRASAGGHGRPLLQLCPLCMRALCEHSHSTVASVPLAFWRRLAAMRGSMEVPAARRL